MNRPVTRALRRIFIFIITIAGMIPAAAAESITNRTCQVTRLRDGHYKYQLSSPARCKMEWEDINKTAYAHGLEFEAHDLVFDTKRVFNVTREHIVLKSCQDYMHFTDDCLQRHAVEEVHCRVNCTLLSLTGIEDQSTSVPNNWICFSESVCVEWWIVALGCLAVLLVIGFIVVCRRRLQEKCRRREDVQAIAYTPATEQIKVQME